MERIRIGRLAGVLIDADNRLSMFASLRPGELTGRPGFGFYFAGGLGRGGGAGGVGV